MHYFPIRNLLFYIRQNGANKEFYAQKERLSILFDLRRQVMARDISDVWLNAKNRWTL